MTGAQGIAGALRPSVAGVRRALRDQPIIPLLVLLGLLIVGLQLARPGMISPDWASNTIRFAVPLAILAACQSLTMLTGGIDLSAASVASMSAYVIATQSPEHGPFIAIAIALAVCAVAGLINGIGVGIFRVHPLIMTLAMSLVVLGFVTVYQRFVVAVGARTPDVAAWLGGGNTGGVPNSLLLFVPLAALIILGLRRSGYGRLLYAVGDNETAARLSGVRIWQVLLALYVLSAVLAGLAGLILTGVTNSASATLADRYLLPSVAAAVIGGTSIFGGRGGYSGTIVGALILTVLTSLLTVLQMPEPVRQILFGAIILAVAAAYTRITEES
jgi:ribose transport system permease protein